MHNNVSETLPYQTLRDLVAWLEDRKVSFVVIGGIAVCFLARPRITRDVDAVVLLDPDQGEEFLAAGASFGFVPRISESLRFARQRRVLLMHHQPTGINVDVSLGVLPFEKEMIQRSKVREVEGTRIPLPTPEDLIIMKAVANRRIDQADIISLLDIYPKLDRRRVRKWVKDFAATLEMPEILDDLERLLAPRASTKRRATGRSLRRPRRRGGPGRGRGR